MSHFISSPEDLGQVILVEQRGEQRPFACVPGGGASRKLDTRDQAISYKRPYSRRSQQAGQASVGVAARLFCLRAVLQPKGACGGTGGVAGRAR